MRLAARLPVLAGTFASQQLAYAHLLDAAAAQGLSPDLDHVEVVRERRAARLAAWFAPETAARVEAAAGADDTLVVVLPGALTTGAFAATDRLRLLGGFRGTVTRAVS